MVRITGTAAAIATRRQSRRHTCASQITPPTCGFIRARPSQSPPATGDRVVAPANASANESNEN